MKSYVKKLQGKKNLKDNNESFFTLIKYLKHICNVSVLEITFSNEIEQLNISSLCCMF